MSEGRGRVLAGSESFGQAFPEHLTQHESEGFEVIPNGVVLTLVMQRYRVRGMTMGAVR